jgi:HK97 family phage major capsid protein/HK97 family phage prohead protease
MMSASKDGSLKCPNCGYEAPASASKAFHWDVETKGADWDVKETGNGTLVIEGYASTWIEDRDGDTIMRDAFDESLPNYLNDNPVLLKDHDRTKVLGAITKAVVDDYGLKIRAEVPKPEMGEEAWKFTTYNDIKRGLRRALSIGGVFSRGKDAFKNIYKVNLYEISNIAVPSNPKSLFRVISEKGISFAEYKDSAAQIDNLPDEDFAYIEPGGEKDSEGKTTPRDKRHFPIHDASHVRNALARLSGSQSPFADKARPKVMAAAKKFGIDVSDNTAKAESQTGGKFIMNEATKSADGNVTIKQADLDALIALKEALESDKKAAALEVEAEKRAREMMAAEEKAAKDAAESKTAEEKRLSDLVDAKLATLRSGRKYVATPAAGFPTAGTKSADKPESMVHLLYRKAQGDPEAREKLMEISTKSAEEYGIKALGEATASAGYLVPPVYWQQGIAEYRLAAAKVRALVTVIPGIATNLVYMPRETGIASVGWTAENAAKPSTDQTFGQIAVNIFTLAGISKVSRQLLEDSSPAVDMIVRKDLGRLLGQAEDIAFINGSGTGQPTGLLNTTGILTGAISTNTIADAIASAISAIQSNYFGDPEVILIHPKHLNTIRTAKDANNRYIFEPSFFAGADARMKAFMDNNGPFGPNGTLGGGYSNMPGDAMGRVSSGPQGTVWGLPLYADANIPTPANAGQIVVGALSESYVLERTGVTIDVSSEAGTSFEQNQTWFRGEERLGFTAARQPTAVYTITGLP